MLTLDDIPGTKVEEQIRTLTTKVTTTTTSVADKAMDSASNIMTMAEDKLETAKNKIQAKSPKIIDNMAQRKTMLAVVAGLSFFGILYIATK